MDQEPASAVRQPATVRGSKERSRRSRRLIQAPREATISALASHLDASFKLFSFEHQAMLDNMTRQTRTTTDVVPERTNDIIPSRKLKPLFTYHKIKRRTRAILALPKLLMVILTISIVTKTLAYQLTNNLIANNLPPKFVTSSGGQASNSEIVVRVKEGAASIGKLIHTLKGEDPDEDPLTFGVLGSLASELLRIENVPGNQANVYLRKELDRETTESYQVVITLTDGKLGRGNWITKSMLIIVEDVNDNYPVFAAHKTTISIREDARVPLVIETLEATDQDEGRFGQVIYKLEQLDNSNTKAGGVFSIDTVDGKGVINLVGPLDYEQRSVYQLRVLAIDRAVEHERLTASTSIMISVEDCEDQPPLFTFLPSITRIPESLAVGAPVVRVAAVDGDRGINNPIQYKLISVNGHESGPDFQLFFMDQESGLLSVAHELDREAAGATSPGSLWSSLSSAWSYQRDQSSQPGSYVVQVRATELGSSSADNSVTSELTVLLTDVNDESPTFNQASYYGEILENSTPDNLVNFIWGPNANTDKQTEKLTGLPVPKVFDRDQGTNGTFSLHLEGEHSQLFDIWPHEATNEANFMIKVSSQEGNRLANLLDYERNKMFQFSIVAREKSNDNQPLRAAYAQMTVLLKDANDNYPQFESELYRVEIPENAIRGMHVCAVKASDLDSGLYGSQGVRYTEIRGEKANKFKLDPLTGVITLKTNEHGFDRETIAQHHLIVEARDANGSGNRNTTQLLIVLTDVNDQKPKFMLDQYEAFIYENELDFQSPLQVQAIDNDLAGTPNSRVSYAIVAGDPQSNFTIDPQTGRIRVRNQLVLSQRPPHSIQSQPGEADIVLESGVSAPPASAGLDFEGIAQKRDDTRQFNLTVRATDSGIPEPLHDLTHVVIFVYDKNDHAPIFTRSLYTKSIREDAKEGSQVIQVLAQDGDHSPTHSKITYRISSGASDKFVIDSDSGLISVANGANLDIDRVVGGHKRTNYQLNVIAFDGSFGPSQKSASTLVNISIIDVNNKPPEFITLGASSPADSATYANQQLPVVYINEDAPYGLRVTRVYAMDLDSSADLRYSINYARSEARNEDTALVDPNIVKDLFSIEPNDGIIKVVKQLDRELFDQVKLRLQVEDLGAETADQVAHTYLLIKITDVNDNRPVFKRPLYKAVVNENSISGTSVITLTADDRDLNKTLKYSLDGAPEMLRLVRINPRSGEIMVNDKIDRELYPTINVTARAEDNGHPHPLTGSCQLLITVRDENDNNPIFLNSSQQLDSSFESTYPQTDPGPKNHKMNESSYRHRSSTTPSHRSFPLEGSQTSLNPTGLQFLSPGATARVREDAPVGHQIAYVRAEDADLGNNARVTYLIDATSSGAKFRIDRDSGVISVAGQLDRETSSHYTLIIEACDNYDLGYSTGESRRAFTKVNILVTDTNDNAPYITTNLQSSTAGSGEVHIWGERIGTSYEDIMNSPGPYEVPLPECLFINEFQPINEPILTVTAFDADDPNTQNGQMDLAIVNNPPQNELFGLVSIASVRESPTPAEPDIFTRATTTSESGDFTSFGGDLLLDETQASKTLHTSRAIQQENTATTPARLKRHAPTNPEPGNFYSLASRSGSRQDALNLEGHRKPAQARSDLESPLTIVDDDQSTTTPTPASPLAATMSSVRHGTTTDIGEKQMHLVVSKSLKERVGNYSIVVRATDRGEPALSSVKVINVCVQDVNNHAPVFVRPPLNHTMRVLENATIGTYVTQVEATDQDHGINGELQYSLKPTNIQNSNNDWQSFKIDRLTGVIKTAKLFNRQLKKYYTLRVKAQDLGRPTSLSSDIDISIIIVNSGQYQPEFETQTQVVKFTENVAPGLEWFTLLSTVNLDDDPALINPNANIGPPLDKIAKIPSGGQWLASPCYFIVDSDDQEQVFSLDRYTHRLSNQKVIDREKKSNYTLLVQATNNCNRPPVYTRTIQESKMNTEGSPPGSSLNQQEAVIRLIRSVESPSKENLKRSIEHFQLTPSNETNHPGDTKLHLKTGLRSMEEDEDFKQSTVDAQLLADKSLLQVFIKIKDVNDNAPRFTQRVYTGGITTEADFGTVFMIAQAVDADLDANSQIVYSIVKPVKSNLSSDRLSSKTIERRTNQETRLSTRQRRAAQQQPTTTTPITTLVTTLRPQFDQDNLVNDIPMNEGDDLFVINPQTGEISLNFDPQKNMKGYFEFEIMANDTDGLFDSAKVFIYLLRQDQRVKFVLRLTPQELRQRLNKFRSVFGNITGAIVNIDSYKYFENHDGTVDKKKTSLYLHFVNPDDNTIIDVDKVLTLIDNNIEYLDELYKEFHVLSSEAAHLPLSSSALIDPIDQIRTGLMGVSSFLVLILVLVIALCVNQRSRYERQLKAATVNAFGSSPLHLDPDYHGQTNLPNTNLHKQDPNPIWINGYNEQDWLNSKTGTALAHPGGAIEDGDYLSSGNSDLNSLSGVNQLRYNAATTATPRDSLNSSQGRVSGSGSGSMSTTNDRQALCARNNAGRQTPQRSGGENELGGGKEHELSPGMLKGTQSRPAEQSTILKKRSQLNEMGGGNTITHSTFGAYKEVTIYTAEQHHQQHPHIHHNQQQQQHPPPPPQQQQKQATNNLVRTVKDQAPKTTTSQVNKIASQLNAKHQAQTRGANLVYITSQQDPHNNNIRTSKHQRQQHIMVHPNGTDVNQGIISTGPIGTPANGGRSALSKPASLVGKPVHDNGLKQSNMMADNFETNLSKLSILNLETTEL